MRFNSTSQISPSSPTQLAKSDEEHQQRSKQINQSNNELNKRRPISAFYNQFQKTPPMRRSAIPDLVSDDQAVRRLNSPLPPKTPTSNTFQNLNAISYLEKTAAYANPLQMQRIEKKPNIYGQLECDPIVDDVQYRKFSQNQSQIPAPHPPIGIPLNSNLIKPNPTNDYIHSLKSNDLAVRSLRKDNEKEYLVNKSNPFANVLHRCSSSNFFQQQSNRDSLDNDDLLPETTSNYLINVKKQLKPTRSMTMMPSIDQLNNYHYLKENDGDANRANVNNFMKSNSLSNCLVNAINQINPKNNIYKKQTSITTDEQQLEDMLSNLNEISRSPDLVMNKYKIVKRDDTNRDRNRMQKQAADQLNRIQNQVTPKSKLNQNDEKSFGFIQHLVKSPTELMNPARSNKLLLKSRTQGSLSNEFSERDLRQRSINRSDQQTKDQHVNDQANDQMKKERELDNESPKSIWPSQIKKKNKGKQISILNYLYLYKPIKLMIYYIILVIVIIFIAAIIAILFIFTKN